MKHLFIVIIFFISCKDTPPKTKTENKVLKERVLLTISNLQFHLKLDGRNNPEKKSRCIRAVCK